MRRTVLVLMMLLVSVGVIAQDAKQEAKPEPKAASRDFLWARVPYRLDYAIKELEDGKLVNTRTYSMVMQSAEERGRSFGEVKAGSRVPIVTESKSGGNSIQYMDVGVNISAQLYQLEGGNLLLMSSTDISSLALPEGRTEPSGTPIVRGLRSNTTAEVNVGKANQIASVDDPTSKHRFQIEVTLTKLR